MAALPQAIEQGTRHQVHLERLKSGEANAFAAFLTMMDQSIRARLGGRDLTEFSRKRLERLLASVGDDLTGIYAEHWQAMKVSLIELGSYEAGFEARSLNSIGEGRFEAVVPSSNQVKSAILTAPLSVRGADGGKLLEPFVRDWSRNETARVVGAIRQGYFEGQTTSTILQAVRGTRVNGFRDGILAISNRGASAIVRTAVQHAASQAKEMTWQENSDIVKKVQWVSTLDTRTTQQCQALDGREFPLDSGPRPPIHINCRSTVVPVLSDEFKFLSEGRTRSARDDDGVGRVDANLTYYEWLKRQPAAFQDSAIGPVRAKLLRDGGLTAERFSELSLNKNFLPLSLSEMRRLEPTAFTNAFPSVGVVAPAPQVFKYESFAPVKRVADADAFLVANGIADAADLKGLSIEGINKILPAAQEVVERFNLKPLAAFGPAGRFNVRTPRNAMAAIFSRFKANEPGGTGLFHAPTTLGKRANLVEQKRRADHWGDKYYNEAQARLDNSKAGRRVGQPIDDEVHTRFAKLDPEKIGHTVGSRGDVDSVTAITVYHEYGHVIHLVDDQIADRINAFVGRVHPERTGWDHLLSKYAGANSREYVAEAFAVYMGEPASQHFRIHPELLKIFQDADKKQ